MIGKALKITNDRKQNIANKFLGMNEKKHIDKVFLGTQGQLFQRFFFSISFYYTFFGGGGVFDKIIWAYFHVFQCIFGYLETPTSGMTEDRAWLQEKDTITICVATLFATVRTLSCTATGSYSKT